MEDALQVGEALRLAAIARADGDAPVLSGHGMAPGAPHVHAFYLPEDLTRDGHIDHITVHAPAGLCPKELRALDRITRIWLGPGAEWRVTLEAVGRAVDLPAHEYLGSSRTWVSATPYLHPWFRKKRFDVEDQLRRELQHRGLPTPALERLSTVRVGRRQLRPRDFHLLLRRGRRPQPDTRGSFWRLSFPEAVPGPVALGFGCHYGLGIFRRET